jgi:hypothetical protein
MPRFKVGFSYREGGSVVIIAKTAEDAQRQVELELATYGVDNISDDGSYSTDHRDYGVDDVEEITVMQHLFPK